MNKQIAVHHHESRDTAVPMLRWLQRLSLAALAAWTLHLVLPVDDVVDNSLPLAPVQELVHWRDAAHDWLLVTDPDTRELVIYDANDGRPLQRLGAADGMGGIRSLVAGRDTLLVVSGPSPRMRLFKLPEMKQLSLAER